MRDSGFILLLLLLFGWNNQAESLLRLSRPLFFVSLMVPSFWEQELTLYSLMPRSRVRNRRLSMAGPLRSRKIPCYIFFILCALSLFSSVSFLSFSFRVCSKPENIFGIKEGLAAKESLSPIHTHTQRSIEFNQVHSWLWIRVTFYALSSVQITRWCQTMHVDLLFFLPLFFYSGKPCF